jgi:hypothetical protein
MTRTFLIAARRIEPCDETGASRGGDAVPLADSRVVFRSQDCRGGKRRSSAAPLDVGRSTVYWRTRRNMPSVLLLGSKSGLRLDASSGVGRQSRRRSPSVMTSTPVPPAPPLTCPQCSTPLTYRHTVFGGIEEDERWDYYDCWNCGPFQFRERTGALRPLRDPSTRRNRHRD